METECNLLKLTEETDWETLIPELVKYAERRSQRGMHWRGATGGPVPGGVEAEDFAQEALVQMFAKERGWNPEQQKLRDFLEGVVSSKVSHQANRRENSSERRATTAPEEAGAAIVDISGTPAPASESPEALLLAKEERDLILAELKDDLVGRAVAELVIDEDLYRSHDSHLIAERLQISDVHVYHAKKRLRRKLFELMQRRPRR